jgi:hypothetical protein
MIGKNMLVLSISEEDVGYISNLLEREERKLSLIKEEGALAVEVCDRLIKRNSGIYEMFKARLIPYRVHLTDIETNEVSIVTFQQFEDYFGKFPDNYNEAQIMQHITEWCQDNNYRVSFNRKK